MVTYAGEIFYASAPDQNHRVFLQIMPDSWDIGGNFGSVGKAHAGYFPKGRIGLFGRYSHNAGTNPRFCGQDFKAGDFVLEVACFRPKRTNWLIVGIQ